MMHQCLVCLKQFEFVSKLRRHQLTHSGQRPFTCSFCNKAFRQAAHLKKHLDSHTKLRPVLASDVVDSQLSCTNSGANYVPHVGPPVTVSEQRGIFEDPGLDDQNVWCNSMQSQTNTEWKPVDNYCMKEQRLVENPVPEIAHSYSVVPASLEQKQTEYSIVKKQLCDYVQWKCNGFGDLAEKENDYHNSQYSECTKSMHISSNKNSLLDEQVQPGLIYSNEDSQMVTAVSDSFPEHISLGNVDNMPKKHQCATCLKYFSAPSKLQRHVLIHTSLRPFGCQFCTKAFRQLAHLKFHLTSHFAHRQTKTRHKLWNFPSSSVSQNQVQSVNTSMNTFVCLPKSSEEQWTKDSRSFKKDPLMITKKTKGNSSNMVVFPKDVEKVKLDASNAVENLSTSKIMHECPVCLKCFSAPSKLRRHCLIHTGQRPFQCFMCYRSFRQLAHLKAHYSVHTGPIKKRTSSLQLHKFGNQSQSSVSRSKRFIGNNFSRKYRTTKQLTFHQQKQISSKGNPSPISERYSSVVKCSVKQDIGNRQDYFCTVCSKHFSAPSKLKRHLMIHTGQRPFRCLVCFRAFTQRSHLKVHRCRPESRGTPKSTSSEVRLTQKHGPQVSKSNMAITKGPLNGLQPYVCNNMDTIMPTGSFVSEFIQGDSGDQMPLPPRSVSGKSLNGGTFEVCSPITTTRQTKEFGHQCTMCSKMFDFPSKLSRHLLIHMDIKPFTCTNCNKSFRQLSHLQNHEKVHIAKRKVVQKGTYKCRTVKLKTRGAPETSERLNEMKKNQNSENLLPDKPDLSCVFTEKGSNQNLQLGKCNQAAPSHSLTVKDLHRNTEGGKFADEISSDTQTQNTTSHSKVVFDNDGNHKMQNVNQCTFCLKTFDFPSKLSRHLLIHTGIRLHECHICHKSFKQLSHLQCHQWVHNRNDKTISNPMKHHNPISSSCPSAMIDEQDCVSFLNQERPENLENREGHDICTDQEHQHNWHPEALGTSDQCHFSSSDDADKIKAETGDRLGYSASKIEACISVIGPDGVSRNLEWNNLGLKIQTSNPDQHEQRTESKHPQDVHYCVPENCSNRSPISSDCCRVGFSFEQVDTSAFRRPKVETVKEGHNKHLIEPSNDLPTCPACSQCFSTLKKLHTHKCPVQGPEERLRKSYHCAVCFKSFEAPSKLKRHYLIHTGQRPFQCTICNKAFTQSGHLKTHMMSHR